MQEAARSREWRAGSRDEWPAPDGFPREWESHRPAVGKSLGSRHGKLQDRGSLTQMLGPHRQAPIHKHGAKAYDLVYRWNGKTRIVI